MSWLIPHPNLTLTIVIVWCLAQSSIAPGVVFLGAILGIVLPKLTERFWPNPPVIKSRIALVRYILIFIYDVVVANLQVAAMILGRTKKLHPQFVVVPLDLRDPLPLTILANTISLTPGTVSSNISVDRSKLLVHCLDTKSPEETVRSIKERYEKRLQEVFAC